MKIKTLKRDIAHLMLGATSIEKIPKISASGQYFLDPSLPLFKKDPHDKNIGILYPIVIVKLSFFFKISDPPSLISSESRTSLILLIEVAPYT